MEYSGRMKKMSEYKLLRAYSYKKLTFISYMINDQVLGEPTQKQNQRLKTLGLIFFFIDFLERKEWFRSKKI